MSRVKKLGLFFILLFIFICVAIGVLILKIEYFDPYNSVNYSEMIDTEIPKTKNGIYYFKDRFAENYPEEADTNINDRAAYNITFALFDLDTNKLYIYKLDT